MGRKRNPKPQVISKNRRIVRIRHLKRKVHLDSAEGMIAWLDAAFAPETVGRSAVVGIRYGGTLTASPRVHALTVIRRFLRELREQYACRAVLPSGRQSAEGYEQWQLLCGVSGYRLAGLRDIADQALAVENKWARAVREEAAAYKRWGRLGARFCELCSKGFPRDANDARRTCNTRCARLCADYLDRVRHDLGRVARRPDRKINRKLQKRDSDPFQAWAERYGGRGKSGQIDMGEYRRRMMLENKNGSRREKQNAP